jgi:outer membrane protein assembly factor BamB
MVVESVPCVAVFTLKGLHVARIDDGNEGKTVAEYPWATDFANTIASPAVHQNYVLISSGYNRSRMTKLRISLKGAQSVWEIRQYSPVCTPVIYKGHVYWTNRGLWCLDFETGQVKWNGGRFGDAAGSCIITADEKIIVWANDGDLALAETAPRAGEDYTELAWRGGTLRAEAWPHVAMSDGRIYCKDRSGSLKCFATVN